MIKDTSIGKISDTSTARSENRLQDYLVEKDGRPELIIEEMTFDFLLFSCACRDPSLNARR